MKGNWLSTYLRQCYMVCLVYSTLITHQDDEEEQIRHCRSIRHEEGTNKDSGVHLTPVKP